MKQKNIVVIGGGTGTYTVLSGLKHYPVNLSAVVAMADDGGSTKLLREEFGIFNTEKSLADLFNFRFSEGSLKGHNFGNLLIAALTKQLGSFEKAIAEAGNILHIKGKVIPSTLGNCTLFAELQNGQIIKGEDNIDVPKHDPNLTIRKVWLEPACRGNSRALAAIKEAHMIVIGPGDMFSSILPNFLAGGIALAVQRSRAKKVYICNLMTKLGETNKFTAMDFISALEQYIGENILNYVILNTKQPSAERIKKYEKEGAEYVSYDKKQFQNKNFKIIERNFLRKNGLVRHDSDILAKTLFGLL
ncbi:MAG: YvcK family protein [Candidatus Wildermuthbacteria bacterium]|nr:YvcK family protein [Candidatus Wildermuthbacteria bacterium]